VQLFHYHLVTSEVRPLEERYLGKLGFELVARFGRVGEEHTSFEAGTSWEELDRLGFKHRLSQLQRGGVDVVLQPGAWEKARVDHVGVALDEEGFDAVLERAGRLGLRVQERDGRRTFVSTGAGFRIEVHPPRDWLDELLEGTDELRIIELRLRAQDPALKATSLADLLGVQAEDDAVRIGTATVRFVGGGPQGRPELDAERLL
jgi:hypothetical protein